MSKKDYKISLKLLFNLFVAVIVCMLCYATIESISIVLFTEPKGVYIYSTNEDGSVNEKAYYYKQNETIEDVKLEDDEVFGEDINTERSRTVLIATALIEQVSMFLIILLANDFAIKEKSRNHHYEHTLNGKPFDKFKGFKWGFFASIPFLVSYVLLIIGKITNWSKALNVFKMVNWQTLPLVKLFCLENPMSISSMSWVSVLLCVVCWAILPVITQLSFMIGVNDGKLYKKIVYEK